MFPGSYGYRVAQPQNPPKPTGKPKQRYRVWGFDLGEVEWLGGTIELTPDDYPDVMAGGSDGTHNYLFAVSAVAVDQFDKAFTTRLNQWTFSLPGTDYFAFVNYDAQHVCANESVVVVLADVYDPTDPDPNTGGADKHYLFVKVFDTGGTPLFQHLVYTTDPGSGDEGQFGDAGNSGSCTDGEFVYFWHTTASSNNEVAKIELATGTLTSLFFGVDIGALSPDMNSTWINTAGLVIVPGGDLILVGDNIARVKQDGTPVWFTFNPNPTFVVDRTKVAFYIGCTHSGRNTVWASGPSETYAGESPIAHEFSYDGFFIGAAEFVEPVSHTWLTKQP